MLYLCMAFFSALKSDAAKKAVKASGNDDDYEDADLDELVDIIEEEADKANASQKNSNKNKKK